MAQPSSGFTVLAVAGSTCSARDIVSMKYYVNL